MRESQNAWVLQQLKSGNSLSSYQAVQNYGIQDLPKRISELRRSGYQIESERVNTKNRFGGNTHYSRYWMAAHGD